MFEGPTTPTKKAFIPGSYQQPAPIGVHPHQVQNHRREALCE
jgi:hypothetical protein